MLSWLATCFAVNMALLAEVSIFYTSCSLLRFFARLEFLAVAQIVFARKRVVNLPAD